MTRTLRATAISLAATLAATLGLTQPAWAASYSASLTTAVASLPVATEVRTGYSRDLFPHWIDADGDGCSTRNEVLIAEATTKPTIGSSCSLSGGRWYSYYDNAYWTLTGDLDIDHMALSPRPGTPAPATGPPAAARPTPTTSATAAPSPPSPTT
nr:hypothetical protein [Micromonospora kangleipakensis]